MSDIAPLTYPPETILTTEQVANWLQVSTRTVEAMPLPKLKGLGPRLVRYSAGQVLAYLEGRAA
jgi:predicted DNA-binding transcriptional regulator AlpA